MRKSIRIATIIAFAVYLLAVAHYALGLYVLAFMRLFNPHLLVRGIEFSPQFNFIPFANTAPTTFLLNIVFFVPFGFLLPAATKIKSVRKVLLCGLALSLAVELLQLGIDGRITDINDLMTNVFGAWIGYLIYKFIRRLIENGKGKESKTF